NQPPERPSGVSVLSVCGVLLLPQRCRSCLQRLLRSVFGLYRRLRRGGRHLIADRLLGGCAEKFGMQVAPLLLWRLFYFHLDAVGVGISVMANASDLPGNLHVRLAAADDETVVRNLTRHNRLCELTDDRELITEVLVEGLKVVGQSYGRHAMLIGDDVS